MLIIIGLLVGGSITATNNQMAAAKKTQTLAKMDTLEQAIAAFVALNGRLPCPAHSGLLPSNPNFGIEFCTGDASKQVTPVPAGFQSVSGASQGVAAGDQWVIHGAVPVRTLQLPDEFIVDGWDNRFSFIVTEPLAGGHSDNYGTPPGNGYRLKDTTTGLLTVKDAAGGIRTNQAAYVFLSHGANGFGAWLHDGNAQRPASPNVDELENGSLSGGFNEIFVQKEANSQFDDIVRYKMKWQLVREAGAIISTPECSSANDILNQVISCNSSTAMPDCNSYLLSFANQVNNWCIQQ